MNKQRIIPNIWCHRNAEAVGAFYADVFSGIGFAEAYSFVEGRYPDHGLPEFQREFAGQAILVSVMIAGYRLSLINAGDEYRPNPSISFIVNFDPLFFGSADESATTAARAALDQVWVRLSQGGRVLTPLDEYFFSKHYGWVQDPYGVGWQLSLTNPIGDPRPFIMPALTFGNHTQNQAGAAVTHYCEVFAPYGAESGLKVPYGPAAGAGPASPEALMFGEFRIGDQWFAVMDAGVERMDTFDAGMSLEVDCLDQGEIDRLWDALSAVPEAEQCGWLTDRFGVSWQIVPTNMADLMQHPDAYPHLMSMKKIIIAELTPRS